MKHCAVLTMDNLSDFECYDNLLDEPLKQLGWQTELVSWRETSTNWERFDAVIIRSPWDYQDDFNAFVKVLENIDNSNAYLLNSLNVVRWNIDKIYLKSLEENNVQIVPTLWERNFSADELTRYFNYFDCSQLVIKPRVSANADNTFWLTKNNSKQFISELTEIFSQSEFMVQPFMDCIIEEGEFSLFYFDGKYSHAILKTPKSEDFRVQEEHGGRLTSITPEPALLAQSEGTLSAITHLTGEMPLYARVDFVRSKDETVNKEFALMEAELIEPSLYFNMDENSAQNFANAFAKRMNVNM